MTLNCEYVMSSYEKMNAKGRRDTPRGAGGTENKHLIFLTDPRQPWF